MTDSFSLLSASCFPDLLRPAVQLTCGLAHSYYTQSDVHPINHNTNPDISNCNMCASVCYSVLPRTVATNQNKERALRARRNVPSVSRLSSVDESYWKNNSIRSSSSSLTGSVYIDHEAYRVFTRYDEMRHIVEYLRCGQKLRGGLIGGVLCECKRTNITIDSCITYLFHHRTSRQR